MNKCRKAFMALLCFTVLIISACKSVPEENASMLQENENKAEESSKILDEKVSAEGQELEADLDSLLGLLDKSRNEAVESGASSMYPELFNQSDQLYAKVKEGSVTDEESLKKLEKSYRTLSLLSKASKSKVTIDDNNFAFYDQKSYDEGVTSLSKALEIKDIFDDELYSLSETAFNDFEKVLDSAYRTLSKEERIKAFNAKKASDEVKAYVAKKDDYNKGVEKFRSGDSKYVTKDVRGAYYEYKESKEIFLSLYAQIAEARQKAQLAIDAAKKRVAESEVTALEADKTSPVQGDNPEGFEAEDAKLLEDDDFSSNEQSSVEFADDINIE